MEALITIAFWTIIVVGVLSVAIALWDTRPRRRR